MNIPFFTAVSWLFRWGSVVRGENVEKMKTSSEFDARFRPPVEPSNRQLRKEYCCQSTKRTSYIGNNEVNLNKENVNMLWLVDFDPGGGGGTPRNS